MDYQWDYLNKSTYNNRVGYYKFKREFKFILDNSKNRYDHVLDIAGGSGRFAIPLNEYSNNITVLDINPTAIQILKERNSNIKTICSDFAKIEFQEQFTLILCIEALCYFQNWEEFFIKINTILADDGIFIFTCTNPNSWRYFLRKIRHRKDGPIPDNDMSWKDLKRILNKYNFYLENVEGMNWIPLPLSSNCKLVSFFEIFEKVLGLKYWYSQSPLLLISIKKAK
jgi:SAM-dependent methyltransferase